MKTISFDLADTRLTDTLNKYAAAELRATRQAHAAIHALLTDERISEHLPEAIYNDLFSAYVKADEAIHFANK